MGLLIIGVFCYIVAEMSQRKISKFQTCQKAKEKKLNDVNDLNYLL